MDGVGWKVACVVNWGLEVLTAENMAPGAVDGVVVREVERPGMCQEIDSSIFLIEAIKIGVYL